MAHTVIPLALIGASVRPFVRTIASSLVILPLTDVLSHARPVHRALSMSFIVLKGPHILDISFVEHDAFAMTLVVFPGTRVFDIVTFVPVHGSLAITETVFHLALIATAIWPMVLSGAVYLITGPLTFVLDTARPSDSTLSMATIGLPLTNIYAIAASHAAMTFSLVLLKFTSVDMTITPCLCALAFAFAIFGNHTNIFATIGPS